MQVKKFEAPTIQEALENVKRELGPEAIILQTKSNKRGFGLLSKGSVEVTAAVSEKSLHKKQTVENRMTPATRETVNKLSAERQAAVLDKYMDRNLDRASHTQEQVEIRKKEKRITATRYIDIEDEGRLRANSAIKPPPPMAPAVSKAFSEKPTPSSNLQVDLQDEIKNLKKMIEDLKESRESHFSRAEATESFVTHSGTTSPVLQEAFEQLIMHGVERRYAYALIKKVSFEFNNDRNKLQSVQVLDSLAHELMQSVEIEGFFPSAKEGRESKTPTVVALVGPTGVGKTTTIAKIASEALHKKNLKVGLINLDHQKIVAFDQLATYARILNVPFRSALSLSDFQAALKDFQNVDMILVDTAGCSQKNPEALMEAKDILLQSVPDLRAYTVLSATTRDIELYDTANRLSIFKPRGLIISKMDEASLYGSIYNVSQKVKLPLVYFTTGQRIPEDIEEATRERVVSLVMDI